MKQYSVIGTMSGSSLDGLDIAWAYYNLTDEDTSLSVHCTLKAAVTIPFNDEWIARLRALPSGSAYELAWAHTHFGRYCGTLIRQQMDEWQVLPDFIASHGHTIFHYPQAQFTTQIGCGAAIATATGVPTVCDFRTHDISIGGQGTPLAPIADKYLFGGYDFYLNIGGIANISCNVGGKFIAFDTSAANQLLNALARQVGLEYDKDACISYGGQCNEDLLARLRAYPYQHTVYPKSLDNNQIKNDLLPIVLENAKLSVPDTMRTVVEWIAYEVAKSIEQIQTIEKLEVKQRTLFISGGGGYHPLLVERIKAYCAAQNIQVHIPEQQVIAYKEALLMGLVGVLRIENKPNCLASVTGAAYNSVGGAIYMGGERMYSPA